ncbi:MAG: hypothetical protein U0990_07680 [Candidatus Nanopelagicales bacterium]|nr:hypothetical protein [Candidatus Nanopelagicales bacterium]MDZ4249954.1 hypothetical protein [Candidatus Nanopelagicales bacterium]
MLGLDGVSDVVARHVTAGYSMLRGAHVRVRRAGPFIIVNVVINNVELGSADTGDVITRVDMGVGDLEEEPQVLEEADQAEVTPAPAKKAPAKKAPAKKAPARLGSR